MRPSPFHRLDLPQVRPRILLAEDDAPFRSLLADVLVQEGIDVVQAGDGSVLVERLGDGMSADGALDGYDLLVSDIRMPGHSGLQVLAGMRRLLSRTPVILITAFGEPKLHDLARRFGAVAVLDKPFEVAALCRVVWENLQWSWSGKAR